LMPAPGRAPPPPRLRPLGVKYLPTVRSSAPPLPRMAPQPDTSQEGDHDRGHHAEPHQPAPDGNATGDHQIALSYPEAPAWRRAMLTGACRAYPGREIISADRRSQQ
jgi:5-methylcytosine-specific restriction endonuclease McrA